jgi:sarcosine oxidase subunit alpha
VAALLDAGRDLGIRAHGLQALFGLRLEKGHVIVGMDTELDTTPRRLGMDWAARMEKPFFIGRAALERTAKLPDERRWVGSRWTARRRPRARRSARSTAAT